MEDIVPIEGRKRLTDKQKELARELMVQVFQGQCSGEQMQKNINTLGNMRSWDEEGFIDAVSDSVWAHPDFNANNEGVSNILKWLGISSRWHEIKHKKTYTDRKTDSVSIDVLNKMAAYNKITDGKKFGDKRSTIIIDAKTKPEIVGEKEE